MSMRIGIDLGGTKIEGVILRDKYKLDVVERMRIPTGGDQGYEHVINQIVRLITKLKEKSGQKPEKIGIGEFGVLLLWVETEIQIPPHLWKTGRRQNVTRIT